MAELSISIISADGAVKCCDCAQDLASLVFRGEYDRGDCVVVRSSEDNSHILLQLDEVLGASRVFLTGEFRYEIPFEEKRYNLSPKAFTGEVHYLFARTVDTEFLHQYRNLALNVCDQHNAKNIFPHASANVETRGEAVFFACNAIDGICENRNHGVWPYQSWGINRQADAEIVIDFGRVVRADKAVLFTRADFPHDSWWTEVSLTFSDGTSLVWKLEKNRFGQELRFESKYITWVKLEKLVKADDPSPFPALTQLEIYGVDI